MKWFCRMCEWWFAVVFGFFLGAVGVLFAGDMEQYEQMSELERCHQREFDEARLYDHLKLMAVLGTAFVLRSTWIRSWF